MLYSTRLRLVLSHLFVIVVAMSLSGFLLLSFVKSYFLQAAADSLAAQARITAQVLIPGSDTTGPQVSNQAPAYNSYMQSRVSDLNLQTSNLAVPDASPASGPVDLTYLSDASLQLSSQLDTRIRLLDAQGTVLLDTRGDRGRNLSDELLVMQGLQGRYVQEVLAAGDAFAGQDALAMHVILPVRVEGHLAGVVYLSQPLSQMNVVLYDVRSRLLLSTAIALLLSGLVGLVLSQAISRPIQQLTQAADAVAHGQLDYQVPVRSKDELGRLSQAFNDMVVQLNAARQAQTAFVADVSHELRTPLTTVKGMIESLQDGAVEDLEVRDRFLASIAAETDRLARLVNDLLVLSRADSQALDLRRAPVDLEALARQAAVMLSAQASARQVEISVLPHTSPVLAWADPDRLLQVLVNLLANAVQYSHAGGQVEVRLSPAGDRQSRMQVCDHGIGIPAGALPQVGRRFFRVDKARARAAGGSGLGLSIARALVEAHGGRLEIDSQEGNGTTVSVVLPRGD